MSYLKGDASHGGPTIDPAGISSLATNNGIALFSAYGGQLVGRRRNTAAPAVGASEIAPHEYPDSGGSTWRAYAGVLGPASAGDTSADAPEPGEILAARRMARYNSLNT